MRKFLNVVGLVTLLCAAVPCALAKTAPTKASPGTIVIVFKDGHRQSFNLSDVERVEFPQASDAISETASASTKFPHHYIGKWEVGDGGGHNFFITLYDDGNALRSRGDVRGKWICVNGEAQVTWDDGAQDAIRKVGSGYQKRAFGANKSFNDMPDNVASAYNTTPHPL